MVGLVHINGITCYTEGALYWCAVCKAVVKAEFLAAIDGIKMYQPESRYWTKDQDRVFCGAGCSVDYELKQRQR